MSRHMVIVGQAAISNQSHRPSTRSGLVSFALSSAFITIDASAFTVTISAGGRSICVDAGRIESVSTRDPLSRVNGMIIVLTAPTEHIVVAAVDRAERRHLRIIGSAMLAAAAEARLAAALDRKMRPPTERQAMNESPRPDRPAG